MKNNILLALLALTLSYCGNSVPFQNEAFIRRPVGISATAVSPLKINLSYFMQNLERSFLGYNIYISRNTIGDAEVGGAIPALNIDGQLPSIKHNLTDFDVDNPKNITIDFFSDSITRLEAGIPYFIRITAFSRQPLESLPSNEASVVAIP